MVRLVQADRAALGALLLFVAACTGEVGGTMPGGPGSPPWSSAGSGGAGGGGGGVTSTGGQAPIGPVDCSVMNPPRAPLRRLTRFEYNNTVRDLLGVNTKPADVLPGEELGNGFGNDADALGVSRLLIDGYRTVAHDIALSVTTGANINQVLGCELPADEAGCVTGFIGRFGARAFRRPLEQSEHAAALSVFEQGKRLSGNALGGVQAIIEFVLQSPQFMYRIERGTIVDDAQNLARPTEYEMATRLSFLLWGTAPDAQLLESASRGELSTKEQIAAHATRMLTDPRARDVVRNFHSLLLQISGLDGLVRNADYYPSFTPGLGALYRRETEAFVDEVVWNDDGRLSTLFTAPYTFLNQKLAAVYGITGITGDELRKVQLDPTRRAGLLTQPSILSMTTPGSRTDPVVRGKWVFTKLMCGTVADPPPDIPVLPEPQPGLSVRDRLAQHRDSPACQGCHQLMDPIGFGFERYDGMGQWRDTDNALPIDSSGNIATSDVAGPFDGAVELGQKLAQSKDVQGCFVGAWLTYAYGRAETDGDNCTRTSLEAAFEQSGGRVRDLLVALTQTDAFLYRPVR
ncbi:MAG: hypothetical protein K0R38_3955 [Polyangiaceae bacterium]|nr:hypothetical protein [Polyangiaceae bacterium]